MKEIEIPRRVYRLPKAEIERLYMDVSAGLNGEGKGSLTVFFPVNEMLWVNEERLVTQLKFCITYCRKEIHFYERKRLKANNKATHVNCEGHIERIEWVPEGLLVVPHGSPYHENPDLLIIPEEERMSEKINTMTNAIIDVVDAYMEEHPREETGIHISKEKTLAEVAQIIEKLGELKVYAYESSIDLDENGVFFVVSRPEDLPVEKIEECGVKIVWDGE